MDTYEQDILTFQVRTHKSRWTYPMSLFTPKLITNETVPMDLTADTLDLLDTVPEATEGSVRSSTDRPIRSDKLSP